MTIQPLSEQFSVCCLEADVRYWPEDGIFFLGRTDQELSLVCETRYVPQHTAAREDGWRAFRVEGVLDFSLVGILAELSSLLAREDIGLFAVSTYNTDYILTKEERFPDALRVLARNGWETKP